MNLTTIPENFYMWDFIICTLPLFHFYSALLSFFWNVFLKNGLWSSCLGAAEMNTTRNHEAVGWIPGLAQWVKDLALL